jgi:hypothetical protein
MEVDVKKIHIHFTNINIKKLLLRFEGNMAMEMKILLSEQNYVSQL